VSEAQTTQEWNEQENAMRDERMGKETTDFAPRMAQYRLIARVLREPMAESLLPEFAAMVATRAEAATRAAAIRREERMHQVVLTLFAAVLFAGFSGDVVRLFRQVGVNQGSGPTAVAWATAIGVCLLITLVIDIGPTIVSARLSRPTSTR
jgi:hypothetical protein